MSRRAPSRSRSAVVLVSAAVTLTLFVCLLSLSPSPDAGAQTIPSTTTSLSTTIDSSTTTTSTTPESSTSTPTTPTTTPPSEWDGSRWTGPTANGATVSDGTFSGTFVHRPSTPAIASVDLYVSYATSDVHASACEPAPGRQPRQTTPSSTTTTPSTEPQMSTVSFLFEVAFKCNGIYNATATATLDSDLGTHDLTLTALHIAEPPSPPRSFVATDNGNHTVTMVWEAPNLQPPDLAGYRLSRREPSSATFTTSGETPPDARSFTDTNIPATGGSYFYKVETLRKSPNGTLTSTAVVTSEALVVDGSADGGDGGTVGGGGRSVTGVPAPQTSGSGGASHFDEPTTLAADEGELGGGDPLAALPGGSTIQRFAGRGGAGLVKPFAAAFDLAVWAGLLLFLTRRAASAERAAASELSVEHSP